MNFAVDADATLVHLQKLKLDRLYQPELVFISLASRVLEVEHAILLKDITLRLFPRKLDALNFEVRYPGDLIDRRPHDLS